MVKLTTKTYDFFMYKHFKNGENVTDYNTLNKKIEEAYICLKGDGQSDVNFIKCNSSLYVGFSYIKKIECETGEVWIFCLSKVDTQKLAIVNNISQPVQDGRSVYAESNEEGPTTETVILFNPNNGVVIVPRNHGGVSKNLLIKFFYKLTKKRGGDLSVIVNNTDLKNISKIDSIHEIDVSIHRITDTKNLTNAKNSVKKDKKVIERLEAQKEKIVYTGNLNIHNVVKYCKELLENKQNKESDVDKLILKGLAGEREQVIDLINNRLIYIDDKIPLNRDGKLTVENMVNSIEMAYKDNELIIALDRQ